MRNAYKIFIGKPERKRPGKQNGNVWIRFIWLRIQIIGWIL
jgi:hypothetical protein